MPEKLVLSEEIGGVAVVFGDTLATHIFAPYFSPEEREKILFLEYCWLEFVLLVQMSFE